MMLKTKILLMVSLIYLLSSCSNFSDTSHKGFQETVQNFSEDLKISQEEYLELSEMVKNSEEDWAHDIMDSDKIDNKKLTELIIDTAKNKEIVLSKDGIWQPTTGTENKTYSAHVLIENSASMDGYVNGATDFEASIFNLVSGLKTIKNISLVDYGFVDSSIRDMHRLENINQIKELTDNLEPDFVKNQSENRSFSDIAQIINLSAQKQRSDKDDDVVILLSDFIFSPPNKNNASDYLSTQGAYVQGIISSKISERNGDFAIWIVKLSSKFNGTYFDKNNTPHTINTNRPYYIWFFGNKQQIRQLSSSLDLKALPNYQEDSVFIYNNEPEQYNFSVLTTTLMGDNPTAYFNTENALKDNIINKAKVVKDKDSGDNKFIFEVAIDLNDAFKTNRPEYYLNVDNYTTNNEQFKVTNVRSAQPSDKKKIQSATHVLTIELVNLGTGNQKVPKTNLQVNINQNLPKWVKQSSIDDDRDVNSDPNIKDKTFGLYELINPVFQAFYSKNPTIGYINISIEP